MPNGEREAAAIQIFPYSFQLIRQSSDCEEGLSRPKQLVLSALLVLRAGSESAKDEG
jgi:hypothetical protein